YQQLPKIVAVEQLGKPTLADAAAEAVEGAQGHVLLVRGGPMAAQQLAPGQFHQPAEVALPQPLRSPGVAGPQLRDPDGNRPGRGHRRLRGKRPTREICSPQCKGSLHRLQLRSWRDRGPAEEIREHLSGCWAGRAVLW